MSDNDVLPVSNPGLEELHLLARMVVHESSDWRTVAACGRAITAIANFNVWILEVGKEVSDATDLAEILLVQGEILERLVLLCRRFLENSHSVAAEGLEATVAELETVLLP
jgi:hypothetical protein